jgi:cytochrome P450
VQNVVPKVAFTGRRPPLHLDPPEHSLYRRAINPLLTEEKVARLEPLIRAIVAQLLQPLIDRGGGEMCADFSAQMPVTVFAEWMNLRPEQIASLRDVARAYVVAVQTFVADEIKKNSLLLYDMARDLIAERKLAPMDVDVDVTSALLAVRHEGQPLPDDMIVGTVRQVLVVGIVAPSVVIGSMTQHLSEHPDLQQQLRANPALIPAAIDEFLRLYMPYRGFARTPTRDIEINGRTLLKNEPVALIYASACRDESVFPDADQFVLHRPNMQDSLAFGRGPHNCPGAALARLELRVALEELLARTSHIEVNGPITCTQCPEIGALLVPVRLQAATTAGY